MKKAEQKHSPPPLGELTDSIHINVDEIPDYVRDEFCELAMDIVRDILRQPGGREMLDAKTEERRKRLADNLDK